MIARNALLELLSSRTCANSAADPEGLLAEAEVIRCADALSAATFVVSPDSIPTLTRLQRAVPTSTQGILVTQCLRAYEEHRANHGRAIEAVRLWSVRLAPRVRSLDAADLYADCFLVFAEFVAAWNRRQIRAVKCAV